jgi:hypothetical protein
LPDKVLEEGGMQALRRHVNDFVVAQRRTAQRFPALGNSQGAVDVRGGHARLIQSSYLILHQGNQRGNNQGNPGQQHRGQLIADGFSRASGQDPQNIFAREQRINQRLLPRAEGAVTEVLFECLIFVQGCQWMARILLSGKMTH